MYHSTPATFVRASVLAAASLAAGCRSEPAVNDGSSQQVEFGVLTGYALTPSTSAQPLLQRSDRDSWLDHALFVMVGEVVDASTVSSDQHNSPSFIEVRPSRFLQKPAGFSPASVSRLALRCGDVEDAKKFHVGEKGCFYINDITGLANWGGLIGYEHIDGSTDPVSVAAATDRFMATVEDHRARRWGASLRRADAIVVAKVVDCAGLDSTSAVDRSEHDPWWQQSVLEVGEVIYGAADKRLVLRHPASTDGGWVVWPHLGRQFTRGQSAIFVLRRGDPPSYRAAASDQTTTGGLEFYYTDNVADQSSDQFHPPVYRLEDRGHVLRLLGR